VSKENKLPDFLEELAQEIAEKDSQIHVLTTNLEIMANFIAAKDLGKEYMLYYEGSLRQKGIMDDQGNFGSEKENTPSL
jgi:hypothetical protein